MVDVRKQCPVVRHSIRFKVVRYSRECKRCDCVSEVANWIIKCTTSLLINKSMHVRDRRPSIARSVFVAPSMIETIR